MPELPEVETIRRCIAPVLAGHCVVDVDVRRPRMARRNQRPEDVRERLRQRLVRTVGRRGKFIIADVEGDLTLVIHLGMSGRLQIAKPHEALRPHTNVVIGTDRGDEVRMIDPRTFGFVAVLTPDEYATSSLRHLGADAWDSLPGAEALRTVFADRVAPIKALLLDQRIVAGLGNIYADEVLFRAGVHPLRRGGSLSKSEIGSIRSAVRPVLADAIAHGGTSLDDLAYRLPDGQAGEHLERLAVYGRTNEPCRRCGTPIDRVIVAQRSSHFCPTCQPEEGRP